MFNKDWKITEPFDAVIFDCDGTLTSIEGIDYLAELRGVYSEVAQLTQEAMSHTGLNPALYNQRLDLIKPNQDDLLRLSAAYCDHLISGVSDVIAILQALNKTVYIISAGLMPAVNSLGLHLKIPSSHVKAVDIYFDGQQEYLGFDLKSPLILNDGKKKLVQEIQKNYSRILYVGDGMNDLAVRSNVRRFVGFGGVFYRPNIAEASDFYITDYAALLPLLLTEDESRRLDSNSASFYQRGVELLKSV